MERDGAGRGRSRVGNAIALADQRARVAWKLGPLDAVRAAVRVGRRTRRQLALVADVTGRTPFPIPDSSALEPTDARSYDGFARLVPDTPAASLLELLWYVRLAEDGARTLLVARDDAGLPTFSTWMLDAEGQREHASRFGDAFHRLEDGELLLEGIYTYPHARGRGVGAAGIAAACAWAAGRGATRIWVYPYLDNPAVLPLNVHAGFEPVNARVEITSLGQVRAYQEPLTEDDLAAWEQAGGRRPTAVA
jgi:GNAT superfamily N-acetyltransferase